MGTVSGMMQGVGVMPLLFLLFAAHALCDYPLQGDFLSRGKNHKNPIPGAPWYQCLFAHALIHGAAVGILTQSVTFGACEFIVHFWTDYAKSDGKLTFNQDQAIHYGAKIAWWLLIVLIPK